MDEENIIYELFDAIEGEDIEKIKEIIFKFPSLINVSYTFGYTPLIWTCKYLLYSHYHYPGFQKKYEIIKFFLDNGANVNATDDSNSTALMYFFEQIIELSDHDCEKDSDEIIKIIQLFFDNNVDINASNMAGFTVLVILCKSDLHRRIMIIIKLLLERGIDIYKKDIWNRTIIDFLTSPLDHCYINNLHKFFALILQYEAGAQILKNSNFYSIIEPILDYELAKKDKEITKLKKENEELRYRPGNLGYLEVMEDFERLSKNTKKSE